MLSSFKPFFVEYFAEATRFIQNLNICINLTKFLWPSSLSLAVSHHGYHLEAVDGAGLQASDLYIAARHHRTLLGWEKL